MAPTPDLQVSKRRLIEQNIEPPAENIQTNSPVLRLNPDVLLIIFTINSHALNDSDILEASDLASIEQHCFPPALDYNRAASQVCRKWRRVTLGSMILWANAVNVRTLNQGTSSWRDEVLKRTGIAPLTVVSQKFWSGTFSEKEQAARDWLLNLLGKNWNRISRLVVMVEERKVAKFLHNATRCHSPRLTLLAVCGYGMFNHNLITDQSPPFPGASRLHHFRFDWLELDRACAPWSSTVKHLSLSKVSSVRKLLDIFQGVPRLETLNLSQQPMERLTNDAPVVRMRYLKDIRLSQPGSPAAVSDILSHINPARGCSAKIETVIRQNDGDQSPAFLETYLHFMQRCKSFSEVKHLTLGILPIHAWSIPITKILYALFSGNETTYMDLRSDIDHTSHNYVDIAPNSLVNTLATKFDLRAVRSLTLHLPDNHDTFDPSNPDMQTFLSHLTAATEIQADCTTLRFLSRAQSQARQLLFPNLITVKLCLKDFDVFELIEFISARELRTRPIHRMIIPVEGQLNGRLAAAVKGRRDLSVVWAGKDYEYPFEEKRLRDFLD